MQGFGGVLQVVGYAGYNRLIPPDRVGPTIQLAYCWAHARCKLFEVARNITAPIAEDRLKRIADLYKIEAEIRGLPSEARVAIREDRSASKIADFETWLTLPSLDLIQFEIGSGPAERTTEEAIPIDRSADHPLPGRRLVINLPRGGILKAHVAAVMQRFGGLG